MGSSALLTTLVFSVFCGWGGWVLVAADGVPLITAKGRKPPALQCPYANKVLLFSLKSIGVQSNVSEQSGPIFRQDSHAPKTKSKYTCAR